jgi:Fe-S cluster assembly protein SufD
MNAAIEVANWFDSQLQATDNFLSDNIQLTSFQQEQRAVFFARGFPIKKEENWKYTQFNFLQKLTFTQPNNESAAVPSAVISAKKLKGCDSVFVVFINGVFSASYSALDLLPSNVVLCTLKQALVHHADKIETKLYEAYDPKNFPLAVLNSALMTDGMFLYLPKNTVVSVPIHLVYVNTGKNNFSSPKNIIQANENTQVTIIEEHCQIDGEAYLTNVVTDLNALANAKIYYHKIQDDAQSATHLSHIFVNQQRDSVVESYSLAVGSKLTREDITVNLNGSYTECRVNGFYHLSATDQHIDNRIQINHIAPLGNSNMNYKGVLEAKSTAVFDGKIFVFKDAQKTISRQANHNLMLSPEATVYTKPEFEIYADDVKCSHGDTVGQLDAESLFFLRSRGIEKALALKMLTRGFAADVLETIKTPAILTHMNDLLNEMFAYD